MPFSCRLIACECHMICSSKSAIKCTINCCFGCVQIAQSNFQIKLKKPLKAMPTMNNDILLYHIQT